MMKIVLAIGGNSLIRDKKHQSFKDQCETVKETCKHIANLIEKGHDIVITHGNGPQVGFLLIRSEFTRKLIPPDPLDACGASSQGLIGYIIQRALKNEFKNRRIKKEVATVVTQVIVDENDPAFSNPTKPIGPFMTKEEAEERARENGWIVKEDAGRGWRRVVPSPIPKKIIEIEAIKSLIKSGAVVIAVGGGGIPVIEKDNELIGVEAVIDKDLASSLLAIELNADLFLISTAVDEVYLDFGKLTQRAIRKMTPEEAEKYLKEGHFAEGSMAPKIRACIQFVKKTENPAIITSPQKLEEAIKGEAGTRICYG